MARRIGNQTSSGLGCVLWVLVSIVLFVIAFYFLAFLLLIALIIAAVFFGVKYFLHVFGIRRYSKVFNVRSNRVSYSYSEVDGELREVKVIGNQSNNASAFDKSYGAVPRFFRDLLNRIMGRK